MSEMGYLAGGACRIFAPGTLPEFPHPQDFEGLDSFNMRHLRSVFWRAPWFDIHAYHNDDLIRNYVVADTLPGGIPVSALSTHDWETHCVVPYSAIRVGGDKQARLSKWAEIVYKRIRRTRGETLIPPEFELDTWAFWTAGEAGLGYALPELDTRRWYGCQGVHNEALCFDAPILRAEFRYLQKHDLTFWTVNIRWERAARNRLAYLVPHQMLEIDILKPVARTSRYVPIPGHWHSVEVPRGCTVELPAVLTYLGSYMREDVRSRVWVAFYTEWAARAAAFLLWDVYDNYRLWCYPPVLCAYIRSLDLALPLGSRANYAEVLSLLAVITTTAWESVPEDQRKRGAPRSVNHSPGRREAGGDFIWYDPWTKSPISAQTAQEFRANRRTMPNNQPCGDVFEPNPAQISNDEYLEEEEEDAEAGLDLDLDDGYAADSAAEASRRGPAAPAFLSARERAQGASASGALEHHHDSHHRALATPDRAQQMEIITKFLRESGCAPSDLVGGYEDLVKYTRERMNAAKRALERDNDDVAAAGSPSDRNERFKRGSSGSPARKRR